MSLHSVAILPQDFDCIHCTFHLCLRWLQTPRWLELESRRGIVPARRLSIAAGCMMIWIRMRRIVVSLGGGTASSTRRAVAVWVRTVKSWHLHRRFCESCSSTARTGIRTTATFALCSARWTRSTS